MVYYYPFVVVYLVKLLLFWDVLQFSGNVLRGQISQNIATELFYPVNTNLDVIPPFSDIREACSIWAIQDIICCHPLVSILSSLGVNTWTLHVPSHVNLQPLVMVVMTGGPGPHQPTTARAVKSGQPSCMLCIPLRRGCHGGILDAAISNSNRTIAEIFWEIEDFLV